MKTYLKQVVLWPSLVHPPVFEEHYKALSTPPAALHVGEVWVASFPTFCSFRNPPWIICARQGSDMPSGEDGVSRVMCMYRSRPRSRSISDSKSTKPCAFFLYYMENRYTGRTCSCPYSPTAPQIHRPHGPPMTPTSCHANALCCAEGVGRWFYTSAQQSLLLVFYSISFEARALVAHLTSFRPAIT